MKIFIATLAFAISATGFACPDLSGSYVCSSDLQTDQPNIMEITQSGINFSVLFFNSAEPTKLTADGKFLEYNSDKYYLTYLTVCDPTKGLTFSHKMYDKIKDFTYDSVMTFEKIDSGKMNFSIESRLAKKDQSHYTKMIYNCSKK